MEKHCPSHPLLWCEERRKLEEKKVAQECLIQAHLVKQKNQLNKLRDMNEYKQLASEYNPWGKEGSGAPNQDIRRMNLAVRGLYPDSREDPRTPIPSGRYKFPGTPSGGGGAPLKNSAGKVVTPLKEDPDLSFNDPNRGHVDKILRYKQGPVQKTMYRAELDKLTAEQTFKKTEEHKNLREFEPMGPMVTEYTDMNRTPWGKAGPGGTPWRNPKQKGQNFMKSLGWTNKKVLKEIDKQITSNSPSPVEQIKPLNLERERKSSKTNENLTPCCSRCICECPARYGKAKTDDFIASSTREKSHYPKPIQTAAPRKSSPLYIPKKRTRNGFCDTSPTYAITGGIELVPLLAKRRSAYKPVSLSTTDVTKVPDLPSSWKKPIGPKYLIELNAQIYQRQKDLEIYRQRDAEISRRHYETWQTFWGRPGHGAPMDHKRKSNLNALLYRPPFQDCKYTKGDRDDGY